MKKTVKIVITGGPCAGKTTGLGWIRSAFEDRGYKVLIVPETATELITGGVAPWSCRSNLDFQKCQMKMQIEKEKVFQMAAASMDDEKILIVCDRGALDNRAYMNEEEYAAVLESIGARSDELRDSYDAVFHLATAAKGAEKFYTIANNAARYETREEAIAMDDKMIAAWAGHPCHRIISNRSTFDDKMQDLIAEIAAFLDESQYAGV